MRCDVCGRRLLTAASRSAGRGMVCARKAVARALDRLSQHYTREAAAGRSVVRADPPPSVEQLQLLLFGPGGV